ncbi:hypothetical protein [Xanthobacter variabilis]|uniref:hypothetical protein n=1 Tax=Xanthobacter variabilis TaxID=3119932 RepID=UPI00372D75E1
MKRLLFFFGLPLCLMATGCASLSYPLPSCDGFSRRPLNRSMWDWSSMSPPAPAAPAPASAAAQDNAPAGAKPAR